MRTTATLLDTEMGGWAPVTKHYRTSDGAYLAVEVAADGIPRGLPPMIDEIGLIAQGDAFKTIIQVGPTKIFECDENGFAINGLTTTHEFAPGTTHDDALRRAGYEVGGS